MEFAHQNSPPAIHIEVEIIHGLHHREGGYAIQWGEKGHLSISPDHCDGCIGRSINVNSRLILGVEEWPSFEMPLTPVTRLRSLVGGYHLDTIQIRMAWMIDWRA